MAKNYYFENFENSMEQSLIEDLVIESIKIYGIDAWYIPRTLVGKDDILNEDDLSTFNEAYMAEMYIKSVDGFEGEGDFLSKFGLEIRDSVTLTIARRTYEDEVGTYRTSNTRPMEGDLIYLPLNKKIFEIQHVEHESIFYQMGSLQMYDLRAELFEYSGERFRTGQNFIDSKFDGLNTFTSLSVEDNTFNVKLDNQKYFVQDPNASDNTRFFSNNKLELIKGTTYVFDLSDASNAGGSFNIFNIGTTTQATGITFTGTPGTSGAKAEFTPTTTENFDYVSLNGSPQHNFLSYSETITQSIIDQGTTWTVSDGASVDSTLVADTPVGTAPMMNQSRAGTKVVFSTASSGALSQSVNTPTNSSGFIGSVWVRNASPGLKLKVNSSPTAEQYGAEIDIPQSTSWQRITTGRAGFPGQINNMSLHIRSATGAANASVEIWGVQFEISSGATASTVGDTLPRAYQATSGTFSSLTINAFGNRISSIEQPVDALSDNDAYQTELGDKIPGGGIAADNIIDFSQNNPFGEDSF